MITYWIILLAIAIGVVFIAEKMKQPYPTFLVVIGLIIGLVPIPALGEIKSYAANDTVFQTTVIFIFLSALLGDAALKLPFDELKRNKKSISLLALLGTFLTFLLVALSTYFFLHLSLQEALIFGALMAATDPVSVLSIFKSMGLNKRLSIVVEGESLANDGVAVVLFQIAVVTTALSLTGTLNALLEFLKVATGGVLIGGVFGLIASRITSKIDHYLVETGLSMVLFYGTFQLAEHFGVSGVISVVVGGVILGTYGRNIGMSDLTHEKVNSFWETIAFLSNALIFLLVGLEVSRIDFLDKGWLIVGSILIVLLARFLAVYISLAFDKSIPTSWKPIISWGGLKGSLSIALVLGITPEFEGKNLLLAMTFSNVVFSLLIQGTTLKKLVSVLNVK
ncbi:MULTISPECIES: cation:proton antiporter [Priestia]|jgi:monovalent cation:H+ antiporter, CPA1 family|uniref:Sodium:proton antiporter n=1 Tax=Priestia megaterium TaxID=1404 RepID=A0A6M6DX83_PRIMG|nr:MULTISPECIES: cation:proton antiporter [Priestia]KLV29816.1 sodium:proton antiporter [Priestia megaterium]MBY0198752.1 cation:proton antiporter [Priestia megaterium]MCE4090782.1 cation:proton antiporter [Priestia megaterium]MCR8930038.1 cation:proton antiporter [Priestia megaterium]MCU7712890.1 cation:proton antiporter [Priestia megaterium]